MSESPYAIPEDELLEAARVPVAEQVQLQAVPRPDVVRGGAPLFGDGTVCDADGD